MLTLCHFGLHKNHHDDIVSSIKIHGLLVAVAGWDRKIIIRNIHNSEVIHTFEQGEEVYCIDMNDKFVVAGGPDKKVTVRDLKSGNVLYNFFSQG